MSYRDLIDKDPSSNHYNKIDPSFLPSNYNPSSTSNSILLYQSITEQPIQTTPLALIVIPFTSQFNPTDHIKMRFNVSVTNMGTEGNLYYQFKPYVVVDNNNIYLETVTGYFNLQCQDQIQSGDINMSTNSVSFCDFLNYEQQQEYLTKGASCSLAIDFVAPSLQVTGFAVDVSVELVTTSPPQS